MVQPLDVLDSSTYAGKRPQYDQPNPALSDQGAEDLPFDGLLSSSRLVKAGMGEEKQTEQTGRRGRRRRSSEFAQWTDEAEISSGQTDETNGQTLLWWQRPRKSMLPSEDSDKPNLPPLQMQPEAGISSSLSTHSLRSPAANFLSSMNESLGSPPSISGAMNGMHFRSSPSPVRTDLSEARPARNPMYRHSARNNPMNGSDGSPLGLATAAAELYSRNRNGNSSRPEGRSETRLDQEGSRIGANGRYLLGKTIGFGGFSTIREAWDLGENCDQISMKSIGELHRVAVKIVYSSESKNGIDHIPNDEELKIWESIPLHPNLLPLLHHEKAKMEGTKDSSSVAFLVMPYCQGSLLTYVKNEGILSQINVASTDAEGSLSRSASLRGSQIISPLSDPSSDQGQQHRTGSGFVPRNAGMRVTSVPLSHLMGRSSSSVGSSNSLLRRASSRISRPQKQTNGVPFTSVREVMRQMVDALLCLHCKAHILHGDLKLENILGQQTFSSIRRDRTTSVSSNDDDDHTAGRSDSLQSYHDADTSLRETICWRIADFGASRLKMMGRLDKAVPVGNQARKEKSTLTGGSLAYTAPEMFLPESVDSASGDIAQEDPVSPFASDMWALGCILYCLCSGRLPFADSFEPRLQMKIAKGTWDVPPRLRRRNERTMTSSNLVDSARQRRQSNDRVIAGIKGSNRNSSLSTSLAASRSSQLSSIPPSTSEVLDMSASMPALPDRHHLYDGEIGSISQQSAIVHEGDSLIVCDEDDQEESSAESDADERIDQQVDATSRERVQIRLALRKLLESDPRKRWTIEQLAKQPWLRENATTLLSSELQEEEEEEEEDHFDAESYLARSNFAVDSLFEHTSQGHVPTLTEDDIERGRSKRREAAGDADQSRAARPIDIDRSASRSRSRPGIDRFKSKSPPGNGENSSFETRYKQSKGWINDEKRSCSRGERRVKRSVSADNRSSSRGCATSSSEVSDKALQRSVSRPPRLDIKDLHHTLPPLASDQSPAAPTTSSSSSSANRSTTSRSRSRARDALNEIASRGQSREGTPAIISNPPNEEKLWWQRGRRNGR